MLIEHEDLSREVYKRLKDMILANELKQGEKLKQEKIATLLGVSRMPLHKAFQMLENEMLVENLPRKGFYVTVIDEKRLIDAFEVRAALEGIAARRVTEIITPDEIKNLKSLFIPFTRKKKIDIKAYSKADQQFHDTIFKLCDNQIISRLEVIINVTLMTYRGGLIRQPEETLPEHLDIIDAIENGKGENAAALLMRHSRKTCSILKQNNSNFS